VIVEIGISPPVSSPLRRPKQKGAGGVGADSSYVEYCLRQPRLAIALLLEPLRRPVKNSLAVLVLTRLVRRRFWFELLVADAKFLAPVAH
jgi:hypothetical protein